MKSCTIDHEKAVKQLRAASKDTTSHSRDLQFSDRLARKRILNERLALLKREV